MNSIILNPQSRCCKPPSTCNFTYVNAIQWVQTKNPSADLDCVVLALIIAVYSIECCAFRNATRDDYYK